MDTKYTFKNNLGDTIVLTYSEIKEYVRNLPDSDTIVIPNPTKEELDTYYWLTEDSKEL